MKMELFELRRRRRRRRLWRHFPLFVTDAHKFWRVQSDPPSRSTRVLIEFWGKMRRRRRWVGGETAILVSDIHLVLMNYVAKPYLIMHLTRNIIWRCEYSAMHL